MRRRRKLRGDSAMQHRLKVFVGGFLIGCILCSHTTALAKDQGDLQDPIIEDGIPEEIKRDCEEIGAEFDICPELLEAIAWNESRFIPDVKNKNCFGLCQVNIKIHANRLEKYDYTEDDMLTSYANIYVTADYLSELFRTYGDDDPLILLMYSGAGWKKVEQYKEYSFITNDVDEILTRSAYYERLHGK